MISDLKLYFKPSGTTPPLNSYTNWGGQSITKPWSGASSGGYPKLPWQTNGANSYPAQVGDETFNFDIR